MAAGPWKLLEGRTIEGRYHLIRLLGVGAFGGVFHADEVVRDRLLRRVALKLISPHPSVPPEKQLDELVLSLQLDHPYLLRCFSAGQCELDGVGLLYLATELGEETLEDRLLVRTLSPDEAAAIAAGLASALGYLHGPDLRMVHRDLKPANVLRADHRWKLSDFGTLRGIPDGGAARTEAIGTAEYAPPEAYEGVVSPAWDVWSLGVVLAEALTGRLPFEAATPAALQTQVVSREPDLEALPSPFDGIVRGCLVKDPTRRWTALQVQDALSGGTSREPPRAALSPVSGIYHTPPGAPSPASPPSQLPRVKWRPAPEADDASVTPGLPAWSVVEPGLIRTIYGHSGWVEAAAVSPDGGRILSGGRDRTVRLWDAASGAEVLRMVGHTGSVLTVALSPDGGRALTGGEDSSVRLWDLDGGIELLRYAGHASWVTGAAFSPDGQAAASGGWDENVRLWETASGETLFCLEGHTDWVTGVAFTHDGRRILSGSWDDTIRVWDAELGRTLHCFGGAEDVTGIAASPNPRFFLFTGVDGAVRVWDLDEGREVRCLRGHDGPVWAAAFSPDGLRAVSGGEDRTVRLWDLPTGQEIARFPGHAGRITSVAFDPSGIRAVSAGRDGTVRLWALPPPVTRPGARPPAG